MKKLLFVAILAFLPIRAGNVAANKLTGTAAVVQVSTTSTPVRWIQFQAKSDNAADAFYGSCSDLTATTKGFALPKGSGQLLPVNAQGGYDLAQVCVYAAMSDIIYVSWETF